MEARYLKDELERMFRFKEDAQTNREEVFLDSDNLRDLHSLLEHASCVSSRPPPFFADGNYVRLIRRHTIVITGA